MGRSVTCTFQVNVDLSNGHQVCYGAMSLKQAKGCMLSEYSYRTAKALESLNSQVYNNIKVLGAEIWPQTARGRKMMKLDFAKMDLKGNITHHAIS